VVQRLDRLVPTDQVGERAGLAWAWVRLVTASTLMVGHRRDVAGARRSRVLRVTWMTWAAWGNPKRQTVTALRVRTSTREREVLDLLAEGANNRQIARSLGVSLKTVQNHVSRILDKLQAADRTQAALRAKGLLPPPH
jgi:DNA-binding CsgD family transcriptional regulator